MENGIHLINLGEIRPSKLNPRKTFSEDSIAELAESIKNMGVLQPIIVRPIPDKKTKYEIVCGERRYRASTIAGKETIPAIVRALTDTDAFELMITENLQREDVNPLEEAEAYQKLLTKMNYDIASLCHRFGKSETYIRHRIKLNDLIPDFRNLLESEDINLSMALEITKLDDKIQRELFDDFFTAENSWRVPKTLKDLKYKIENNFTNLLSNAKFSTESNEFTHAGPCNTCLKNTACDGILFPEEPEQGKCMDKNCFEEKTKQHVLNLAKKIQETEPGVLIIQARYGNEEKDVNMFIEAGIDICKFPDNHTTLQAPEEPEMPKAPIKADFEDDEDYNEAYEEYCNEYNNFEKDMEDYPKEVEEFETKIASGEYRKAFIAIGSEAGKIVYLRNYATNQMSGSHVNGAANTAEVNMRAEIVELQMKDKRNFEISFDKSYQQVKDLVYKHDNPDAGKEIFQNEKSLTMTEIDAMILFMIKNCGYNDYVTNILKSHGYNDRYYSHSHVSLELVQKLTIAQKNIIKRAWLINQIRSSLGIPTNELDKLFIEIVKENYPDQVNQILLDEQGKYLKKKEIIDKKISEIESKLNKSNK